MDANKQRDMTFDIMKGIGILLMITCHFFGWNHPYLARSISSFHMPMFFIVAGYFSKSYDEVDSVKQSVKRYFVRLFLPYALTQLAILCWGVMLVMIGKSEWNEVIRGILSLFWADIYGPSTPWGVLGLGVTWFLMALFVAKTLLLVLVSRLKGWAIPVSFVIAIASLLIHQVFPYSIWCITIGMTALPFVTIGWWLRNHPAPMWMMVVAILGWLVAIKYSQMDMYMFQYNHYPLDVIGALGGTSFLYLLSKWMANHLKAIGKVFAYLGIISLAIMCMHHFELASHLGNHICGLVGVELPLWGSYLWRYVLTIALAIGLVHLPWLKKIYM